MAKKNQNQVMSFRKSHLRQGAIANLCQVVYDLCMSANIDGLNVVLNILKDKIDYFNALIHPIMGSRLTPEIVRADERRDQKLIGFNYYIEFCLRHTNPDIVAAAQNIQVVLNNASYSLVYRDDYDTETNTIMNLLEELRNNHAQDIETLQIGFYLDALEADNNDFEALDAARASSTARTYNYIDIQAARAEMEQALDAVRLQLNALAQVATLSGDAENYDMLIATINKRIKQVVLANTSNSNNDDENGNNNQGGENGGDNNQNGGDNTGDDNTPSANA